jgi:hypothetical protein
LNNGARLPEPDADRQLALLEALARGIAYRHLVSGHGFLLDVCFVGLGAGAGGGRAFAQNRRALSSRSGA